MSVRHTISAVIPAFNSAEYIADAVESVRVQTCPVDEIIIVDDGSTDSTPAVIQQLGDGIRYIRQPNAGPSAARNRGVEAARGDLIAFLDADDQWTKSRLELQLAVLERNPAIALIAGDMAEIDARGETIVSSVLAKHRLLDAIKEQNGSPIPDAASVLLRINFIPTGTVLAGRDAIIHAGGFPEDIRYGEDLELWVRIAAEHDIACLPEVLMLRRQHGDNATQATEPLLRDLIKVMVSLRDWEAGKLERLGINPDLLVAQAVGNLGYWQFDTGRLTAARETFNRSLKERMTMRALLYYLLSLMPANLVYGLRHIKQNTTGLG